MQILEDALENLGLILFLQQEVGQLSILSLPQTKGYVNRYNIIYRPMNFWIETEIVFCCYNCLDLP